MSEILKETGKSYNQNFVSSDNPIQNIWNKIDKFMKIGQDKKILVSSLVCLLTSLDKVEKNFSIFPDVL